MKKYAVLVIAVLFAGTSLFAQSKRALKKQKEAQEYAALKEFIEKGTLHFEADWATAQGGARVNLIGNPNYLDIQPGSVRAELPFFGVAHAAVGFASGNVGIKFEGKPKSYEVQYNDKKRRAHIRFDISNKESERFNVNLTIFPNKSATLTITSSKRNSINYDGKVSTPAPKE